MKKTSSSNAEMESSLSPEFDESMTAVEALLSNTPLVRPSSDLDESIFALARRTSEVPVVESKVVCRQERASIKFSPVLFAVAAACLLGVVISSVLFAAGKKPAMNRGLLVNASVQNSVESFNAIHGHSSKEEFAECSRCHLMRDRFVEGTKPFSDLEELELLEAQIQYDPDSIKRFPTLFPKCTICHANAEGADWMKWPEFEVPANG